MKLVTFKDKNKAEKYRIGALISETEVIDLTSLVSDESLNATGILSCFDLETNFLEKAKTAIEKDNLSKINRQNIEICAPVPRPPKIICVGLNYRDHAEESGMAIPKSPIIFSKFTNCEKMIGDFGIAIPLSSAWSR